MSNPHIEMGREELSKDEQTDPFTKSDDDPATYEEEKPDLAEDQDQP